MEGFEQLGSTVVEGWLPRNSGNNNAAQVSHIGYLGGILFDDCGQQNGYCRNLEGER